jgi:uncharacterized protein YndB with AHSA1/START domain
MGSDQCKPVAVSRRIDAPADAVFRVLSNPSRHPDIDGSGMLREGASNTEVSGVGDVFIMKMHFPDMGDYEMDNHVVEYKLNRRIAWEPVQSGAALSAEDPTRNGSRWKFELTPDGPDATLVTEIYDCSGSPDEVRVAVDNGEGWVEGMTKTLELLAQVCDKRSVGEAPASKPT